MNTNAVIQPWLTVLNAEAAVGFYKQAFDAIEMYRLETPDGLVVKLSVAGAEFWISSSNDENKNDEAKQLNGNIRMILIANHPELLLSKAMAAGAKEIFPLGEDHGWKLGRIEDPFGLHWEIGYEVH